MTAFEGKRDHSRLAGIRGVLRSPVINLAGAFCELRGGKGNERETGRESERARARERASERERERETREILEKGGVWSMCSLLSGFRRDVRKVLLSPFSTWRSVKAQHGQPPAQPY